MVGGKGGREDPRDRLGRRERGRAATMIPGIEKRLTTAARIATQLLDYGVERRRFPPPPPRVLISPLLSVLTLPDSHERERRRRRRRFNDNAGYGDGGESDARSVKKFRRSEPRQLLNLAATKRTKRIEFNEVTNIAVSRVFSIRKKLKRWFNTVARRALEVRNKTHIIQIII